MFHYPFMMNNFFMPAFMPRFMPMFMPSFMPTFMPAFMPTFIPTIFTGFMQPFVPQQSIFTCQQNSVPANSTKRARRKQRKNEPLAEVKQKIQVTETSSAAQKPENRIQTTKKAENTTNQTSQTTVEKPENTTSVAPPSNTTSIQTQTSETAPAESSKVTTDKVKKNLGKEFLKEVKKAAKEINCNYKDLLALLNSESSLNPKAINNRTKAAGLLQFMPSTAKDLGTSTEEILNMSATEQLVYVVKYFKIHKKIAGFKPNARLDAADLYALTFLPGRAKREILTDSSEKYYKHNKGLDLDRDGKITKTELAARINQKRVNESIFS